MTLGTSLIRNNTPRWDHHMTLGMVLLHGPRKLLFLMGEVSLYLTPWAPSVPPRVLTGRALASVLALQ